MMCNALGRADGAEKADVHLRISEALCKFVLCEGTPGEDTYNVNECIHPVHDYLADILTDRMDQVIGYPIYRQLHSDDFDHYARLFFNVIVAHMPDIEKLINDTLKKSKY